MKTLNGFYFQLTGLSGRIFAARRVLVLGIPLLFIHTCIFSQVLINEGTNKNYQNYPDEDGEYPDWIEIYNTGSDTIDLLNYSLTDKLNNPTKWTFPNVVLPPGEFKTIFCSGKDRKPITGFQQVVNTGTYNPVIGWNTHTLTNPFAWDGVSNILINTCSYSSAGYTVNSQFNQSATPFLSTVFSFADGSEAACYANYGTPVYLRPNMKINGFTIGTGTIQNSPYDYPAPYGNWYWGARNQILIPGSELTAAGMTAGEITSLAFDVADTYTGTVYDYIEIHMKLVSSGSVASSFVPVNPNNHLHTNFKISNTGETIALFSPEQVFLSYLFVNCENLDNSCGFLPDGSANLYYFDVSTPSGSNSTASNYTGYLTAPVIQIPSGFYDLPLQVSIIDQNTGPVSVYYTLDGSDPTTGSTLYTGSPLNVTTTTVLRARSFTSELLPSPIVSSTYFFNVNHTTPVLSVITDEANLYGSSGIFTNWWYDWERAAYVDYFDSAKQLIFSQKAGIQIDGGAGGSRSHPQHSFRVELDDGVLGDGPVYYPLIPNRPDRIKYGKIYLRNGSNQYLSYPYKDACQVEGMANETKNYYSAWRPVSVYINGSYFGLYELREKLNTEFFETLEEADPETMDILSLSYWYGGALRAVKGSTDSFFISYDAFLDLNTADTSFWTQADQYFDMEWYTDYIIGESWMGNVDWPWNNIRIYRSDKTGYRWRFCLIDLELAMDPGGWTNCYSDHILHMLSQSSSIPYINIWLKSMENQRFRNYFINRFADLMNTTYLPERLIAIENSFYNQTVTEMYNEYMRWGDPGNINQQMENFHNNHLVFQNQLLLRTAQVRNHIQSHFLLPNQVDVTLDIFPEGSGKIHISTITPSVYPWEGVYFNGIPIKIEAVGHAGYQFSHWAPNELITEPMNPVFIGILNEETITFTAVFEALTTSASQAMQQSAKFSVFPNPSHDRFLLKVNHGNLLDLSYQVLDLNGRVVLRGNLTNPASETIIETGFLPPSVYLLHIYNPSGTVERLRFIKTSGKSH
jgi:hypothetical protein